MEILVERGANISSDCPNIVATQTTTREDRGIALVELSVVVTFLFLLFFGSLDVGSALGQQFLLSRLTYEAARLASETPNLETGTFVYPVNPNTTPQQSKLQAQIATLISTEASNFSSPPSVQTTLDAVNREVLVTLQTIYVPRFFPMLPYLTITASFHGPYLFVQSTPVSTPGS